MKMSFCNYEKLFLDDGGRRVVEVTRSCVAFQDRDDCTSGSHNGISADVCICNEDMCNSADTAQHWRGGMFVLALICTSLISYIL